MVAALLVRDWKGAGRLDEDGAQDEVEHRGDTRPRGDGDDPGEADIAQDAHVEVFDAAGEADAEHCAHEGMGGGDGESEPAGDDDGDSSAEIGGEGAGRSESGDFFAHGFHDLVPVSGQAEDDADAAQHEHGNGDGGLRGDGAFAQERDDGSKRADGIGGVVRAMSEGEKRGADCQEDSEHALDFFEFELAAVFPSARWQS